MSPASEPRGGPAPPGPREEARSARAGLARALELVPAAIVTLYGLWLLWPVPLGHMPRSADHPVHLARIVETARQLEHGRLAGWSDAWFFGFPVGELYPQLGDLLVIGVRGLSLGLLDWPSAYALAFTLVFLIQGWAVLRLGRALGLGPVAGVVGAMLLLADPGYSREGGWMYTVWFGVWPQALATSLLWLGLADLMLASRVGLTAADGEAALSPVELRQRRSTLARHVALAGLWLGGALLAHPMTMLVLAFAGPLVVLVVGSRARLGLGHTAAAALLAAAIALALSAWWIFPMLQHRAWMASYGWLFAPLDPLLEQARQGRLTRAMAPAIGYASLGGLAWAAIRGDGPLRAVALISVLLWLLAAEETFWQLRLDHLSEGFTHVQYQRFLIAAKPGLFVLAGSLLANLANLSLTLIRRSRDPAYESTVPARWLLVLGAAPGVGALALGVLLVVGAHAEAEDEQLAPFRPVQLERLPERGDLEGSFRELAAWLDGQAIADPAPWRVSVIAQRNSHWFMDLTTRAGVRLYKPGFTPGDNFVHKPESRHRAVLDALGVRYEIRLQRGDRPLPREVARFGDLRVTERPGVEPLLAHLEGPGELERVEGSFESGRVEASVRGAGEGTRLVFHVGGYPRWRASLDGQAVTWTEVPVWGDGPAATPEDRRAGALRGGKAHGDDGSEPTLLAVEVPRDGSVTLSYRHRRDDAWPLLALAALAGLGVAALAVSGRATTGPTAAWLAPASGALARLTDALARVAHPLSIAAAVAAVVAVLGARWLDASRDEQRRAVGRVMHGAAQIEGGVEPGPLKAGMLIRPAVIARGRAQPARAAFRAVRPGPVLRGWAAVDDDQAKQGKRGQHTMRFELRPAGGEWRRIGVLTVRHDRPGLQLIDIQTGLEPGEAADLRVSVEASGQGARFGYDLELEASE